MIFDGQAIESELRALGVSHVVWIPDSDIGQWEPALEASSLELVRVCREGEAWPLAAGLLLGGASPVVVLQTTGLFESGDALRNVAYDLRLPVFAVIGARNWLSSGSSDSARRFARPVLDAWEMDYVLIETSAARHKLGEHYRRCQSEARPGAVLLAE